MNSSEYNRDNSSKVFACPLGAPSVHGAEQPPPDAQARGSIHALRYPRAGADAVTGRRPGQGCPEIFKRKGLTFADYGIDPDDVETIFSISDYENFADLESAMLTLNLIAFSFQHPHPDHPLYALWCASAEIVENGKLIPVKELPYKMILFAQAGELLDSSAEPDKPKIEKDNGVIVAPMALAQDQLRTLKEVLERFNDDAKLKTLEGIPDWNWRLEFVEKAFEKNGRRYDVVDVYKVEDGWSESHVNRIPLLPVKTVQEAREGLWGYMGTKIEECLSSVGAMDGNGEDMTDKKTEENGKTSPTLQILRVIVML